MNNEEKKSIYDQMYEKAIELLPKDIQLVYLSAYDENLNNCTEEIAECIKQQSTWPIEEKVSDLYHDEYYSEAEKVVDEIIPELKKFYLEALVDSFIEKHKESLIEAVIDSSVDVMCDLCRQSKIYGRVQLFTNYDICCPLYMTSYMFVYEEGVKQVIDALNINPLSIKDELKKYEVETEGEVPDLKERDGNEFVSPQDFAKMYADCPNDFHLAFVGTIPLKDMYDKGFQDNNIIIPKGTTCLLFNHWDGGGTCAECKTIKDLPIVLEEPRESKYDKFRLIVDVSEKDGGFGYSTNDVYGCHLSNDELFEYTEPLKDK